jgi:hypothetical protein
MLDYGGRRGMIGFDGLHLYSLQAKFIEILKKIDKIINAKLFERPHYQVAYA